jgi:plastocyanin
MDHCECIKPVKGPTGDNGEIGDKGCIGQLICKLYDRCYKVFIDEFFIYDRIIIDNNIFPTETLIITILPHNNELKINILQTDLSSLKNKIIYKVYVGLDIYTYWGYLLCIDGLIKYDNSHKFDSDVDCVEIFILGVSEEMQPCIEVNMKTNIELFTCNYLFLIFLCEGIEGIQTMGEFCLFVEGLNNDIICQTLKLGELCLDEFKVFVCGINGDLVIDPTDDFVNKIKQYIIDYEFMGLQLEKWIILTECVINIKKIVNADDFADKLLLIMKSCKSWLIYWGDYINYMTTINLVGKDILNCDITNQQQNEFNQKMFNVLERMIYEDDDLIVNICVDSNFKENVDNAVILTINDDIFIDIDECTQFLCCILESLKTDFACFLLDYALCLNYVDPINFNNTQQLLIHLNLFSTYDISGCDTGNNIVFINKMNVIFDDPYNNIPILELYYDSGINTQFKSDTSQLFNNINDLITCNNIIKCLLNTCYNGIYDTYSCKLLDFILCVTDKVYIDSSNNINNFIILQDVLDFILFTNTINLDISGCDIGEIDYELITRKIEQQIIEYDNSNLIDPQIRTFTNLEFITDSSNNQIFKEETFETLNRLKATSAEIIECSELLDCLTIYCPGLLSKTENKYIFTSHIITSINNYFLQTFNINNQKYKLDISNQLVNVVADNYSPEQLAIMFGLPVPDKQCIIDFLTLILETLCYLLEPDVSGNINNNSETANAIILNILCDASDNIVTDEMTFIILNGQGIVIFECIDCSGTTLLINKGTKTTIENGLITDPNRFFNYPRDEGIEAPPINTKPYLIFNDDGKYLLTGNVGGDFDVKVFSQFVITFTEPVTLADDDFCDNYILSLYAQLILTGLAGTPIYSDENGVPVTATPDLPLLVADTRIDFSNIDTNDGTRILCIFDSVTVIQITFREKKNIYIHDMAPGDKAWYKVNEGEMYQYASLYETTSNNNMTITHDFTTQVPDIKSFPICNNSRFLSVSDPLTSTPGRNSAGLAFNLPSIFGYNPFFNPSVPVPQEEAPDRALFDDFMSISNAANDVALPVFSRANTSRVTKPKIKWNASDFNPVYNNTREIVIKRGCKVTFEAVDTEQHTIEIANDKLISTAVDIINNGAPGSTRSYVSLTNNLAKTSYYIDTTSSPPMNLIVIIEEHLNLLHTIEWNTTIRYNGVISGGDWSSVINNVLPPTSTDIPVYPHASIYVLKGDSVNFSTTDIGGHILISTDVDFNETGNNTFVSQGIVPITDPVGPFLLTVGSTKTIVFDDAGLYFFRSGQISENNMTIIIRVIDIDVGIITTRNNTSTEDPITLLWEIVPLIPSFPIIVPTWEWAVSAGSPNGIGGAGDDKGYGISVDKAGNAYVTGFINGNSLFGSINLTSVGDNDIFVAKLNSKGDWLWAVSAGGNNFEDGQNITIDDMGNTYITGYFRVSAIFGSITLTATATQDMFIAKLDPNGVWLWAVNSSGDTDQDQGIDITFDGSGNVYVAGAFAGNTTFGTTILSSVGLDSIDDIFVAKLDLNGNWIWAVSAGGFSNNRGVGISVDNLGNVFVTGLFSTTALFGPITLISVGSIDIFVAKLDSNGNWIWAIGVGSPGTNESGTEISVDVLGNAYVTGKFNGNISFGSTNLSAAATDIFIAKIDQNGNWIWAVKAGSSTTDEPSSISVDGSGTCYVTGYFAGNALFGSTTLTSVGSADIFVSQLDSSGNWLWSVSVGSSSSDTGNSISIDRFGNAYITGSFGNTISFGTNNLTSLGSNDIFIAKLLYPNDNINPTSS